MNWYIIFPIIVGLLLLRVFWLHVKASNANTQTFKNLEPKDKLAVLKECLLNNATLQNLQNLSDFLKNEGLNLDVQSYKPLLERQLKLADQKANYIECDKLYIEQCEWIDKIQPFEFNEAKNAWEKDKKNEAIAKTLEGISRLYSDKAIEKTLLELTPHYPKARELLQNYQALIADCESSTADEKALEILRNKRNIWINDLLSFEKDS